MDAANTKCEFTSDSADSVIFFGYGFLSLSQITDNGTNNKFFSRNDLFFSGKAADSANGVIQVKNTSTEGTAPCISIHGTDGVSNARIYGSGMGRFDAGIGVGNSAAGDVTGTSKDYKIEIFDGAGNSLGYLQVYAGS